jgi:hypothetical protein
MLEDAAGQERLQQLEAEVARLRAEFERLKAHPETPQAATPPTSSSDAASVGPPPAAAVAPSPVSSPVTVAVVESAAPLPPAAPPRVKRDPPPERRREPRPRDVAADKPIEPPATKAAALPSPAPAVPSGLSKSTTTAKPEAARPETATSSAAKSCALKPSAANPAAAKSTATTLAAAAKPATDRPSPPPRQAKRQSTVERQRARDEEQPRFGRAFFQASGSLGVSIIVHVAVLLVLGMWFVPQIIQEQLDTLTAVSDQPQENVTQELPAAVAPPVETDVAADASANSVANLPVGHASSLEGGGGEPTIDRAVAAALVGPAVALNDVSLWAVPGDALKLDVPDGAAGDPSQAVDGYEEAMDRITHEILMQLLKGNVLVMWLFDQSESMKDDQREIRQRFERVYAELGITEEAKGDALLTSIGSFGQGFVVHSPKPTADIEQIRAAIDQVPVDASGLENMCPAIGLMINQHRKAASSGRRRMMLIVVTDESGEPANNVANLELAINEAKDARCPVYFLGRESVFGYPWVHMQWVHPQTGGVHWLPIDRGPETGFIEQLQTDGFRRRYDAHASGFGPYEQCRLARESGGIFFMLPSPEVDLVQRDDRKYELRAMRPYLPDLGPREAYIAARDNSPLRTALWQVVNDLNPYRPDRTNVIEMRLQFSADPAAFAAEVQVELNKSEQYVKYLHACEQGLESIKSRRDNEPSPRWRANYDLLYAQVLAYKVRLYEYGAYLTEFIKKPKVVPLKVEPNLTLGRWDIRHRQETITGDLTRSHIERSAEMFRRVITDHAGTPWAARAEWELARGFGVDLQEVYFPPPNPNPPPVTVTIPVPKL